MSSDMNGSSDWHREIDPMSFDWVMAPVAAVADAAFALLHIKLPDYAARGYGRPYAVAWWEVGPRPDAAHVSKAHSQPAPHPRLDHQAAVVPGSRRQ